MIGLASTTSSFVEGVGENTKDQSSGSGPTGSESTGSNRTSDDMVSRVSSEVSRLSLKANAMDSLLDIQNPVLNSTLDGVLKIGGVGAAHAATQEAYSWMRKGSMICNMCGLGDDAEAPKTRRDVEKIVYKAGKEGLQWGMVAGMYAGLEYGMEKARGGKHDWKNAAVGGALTGAIVSISDGRISQDRMLRTALTASALAIAADLLKSVHLDM